MTDRLDPKVSVCLQTYNHASYIGEALDGVLAQKTDFPIEIVVGEDDSEDGTREIVQTYAERHPQVIRPFYRSRKDVIYVRGYATGRRNFMLNLEAAQGSFIALLDGDDFWLDPYKLQRQVELLEESPGCSFSFHNVWLQKGQDNSGRRPLLSSRERQSFPMARVLSEYVISTSSVVFRRGLFDFWPKWFTKVCMADWPLHVLNAHRGPAIYLPDIMGVYRRHELGQWSVIDRADQLSCQIETLRYLRSELAPNWAAEFAHASRVLHALKAEHQIDSGNYACALRVCLEAVRDTGLSHSGGRIRLLRNLSKAAVLSATNRRERRP